MAYLSRDSLRAYAFKATASQKQALHQRFRTKTASVRATVFLSHSHDDADLIESFLVLLNEEGVLVYVDWKDPTMPRMTTPDTATRLKQRIKQCGKFMLLATNNALDSRWAPWELGIADSQNGMTNVAVIPVQDASGSWRGSEYVGIYSRVEKAGNGRLAVFEPNTTSGGVYLSDWLVR